MADSETLSSGAELLEKFSKLEGYTLLSATILGVLIVVAVIIFIIFKYKQSKVDLEHKSRRAKQYADSSLRIERKLDSMSKAITTSFQATSKNMVQVLGDVNKNLTSLRNLMAGLDHQSTDFKAALIEALGKIEDISKVVDYIMDKTKGVMSGKDSYFLIKLYFFKVICYEIEKVVHKSLVENDFVNRRTYVTDKVRTDIGNVLSTYRADISEYELSINAGVFFKVDSSSVSERFMLVDLVWRSVEDLFTSNMTIDEKKEEASLRILNVVKDYTTEILAHEFSDAKDDSYVKIKSNHG